LKFHLTALRAVPTATYAATRLPHSQLAQNIIFNPTLLPFRNI